MPLVNLKKCPSIPKLSGFIINVVCVCWEFDNSVVCCHSCFNFITRHLKIELENSDNICVISLYVFFDK